MILATKMRLDPPLTFVSLPPFHDEVAFMVHNYATRTKIEVRMSIHKANSLCKSV